LTAPCTAAWPAERKLNAAHMSAEMNSKLGGVVQRQCKQLCHTDLIRYIFVVMYRLM
jgi:hypothetical protein